MTRETKVGLMMVALLVGVFGFLLYKRIHKPLEVLATQESTDSVETEPDQPSERQSKTSRRDQNDSVVFEKPKPRRTERPVASKSSDDFSASLLENDVEISKPTPVRPRLKPPEVLKSDEDEFDQFVAKQATASHKARETRMEPANDAFDDLTSSKQKPSHVVLQVGATKDSDPFSEEVAGSVENEPVDSARTLSVPAPIEADEDEVQAELNSAEQPGNVNSRESRRTQPRDVPANTSRQPGRTGRPALVQQTSDFETELESAPPREERRRPAPVTFEDRSFSPEAAPRGTVAGPTYVIEPNDNYWTISRKRYGVGRYYMALARHNERVISDPKRMKPGITISTPDPEQLEQKYADLIPKPAPADPAPAVVTTQSRKPEESAPAGFFVSADGSPMYRIAGQDTLSEIAKSHLGRSSRWVQILEMNRNVLRDGNELKIGTVLRLPADASRVQIVGTARQYR